MAERIRRFLEGEPHAVAGASRDRAKYGNKVLRCYLQHGKEPLYAVNPHEEEVEGVACRADLASLPEVPRSVSIITPPEVTRTVVEEAIAAGVGHLWMQPGAEDALAVERAREHGLTVIAGGPCLLVVLGFRE